MLGMMKYAVGMICVMGSMYLMYDAVGNWQAAFAMFVLAGGIGWLVDTKETP